MTSKRRKHAKSRAPRSGAVRVRPAPPSNAETVGRLFRAFGKNATPELHRAARDDLLRIGRRGAARTELYVLAAHEARPGCSLPEPAEVRRIATEGRGEMKAGWRAGSAREMVRHTLHFILAMVRLLMLALKARLIVAYETRRRTHTSP